MDQTLRRQAIDWACRLLWPAFRPWRRAYPAGRLPARIVILKPCCLGDVLQTTPLATSLRAAFPSAHIAWAVGGWARPVLIGNPHLDELVDAGPVGSGRYTLGDLIGLIGRLRAGRFDTAFVLDRSPVLGLAAGLAGIPWRIGYDAAGRGFAHTVPVAVPPVRQETALALDALRAIGITPVSERLLFVPSPADRERASALLGPDRPLRVAVHPGGGANPGMTLKSKRWPHHRFAAIADRLVAERGAQIVLVGGSDDRSIADAMLVAMKHKDRSGLDRPDQSPGVIDLVGRTTLGELGAVLERCHLFLGNDTGPVYLAAAVGTPVVALFGPTDPRRYAPATLPGGPKVVALRQDDACACAFPPGQGFAVGCNGRCMTALTMARVWDAVSEVLRLGD